MKSMRKRWLPLLAAVLLLCVVAALFLWLPSRQSKGVGAPRTANVNHALGNPRQVTTSRTPTPITVRLATRPIIPPTTSRPVAPTATASAPVAVGAAGSDDGPAHWTLIYSDDFNGTQLDPTWGKYGGPHAGGQSYYDPNEVQVQNGMLMVSAERKTEGGLPYTTGGLAAFRLAQTYGKYEIRVKLPHGKGLNPYTILWPNQAAPNTAQVDVFESPPANKGTIYFTNHGTDGTSSQVTANGDFADEFHTITCEWMPGKLRLLVDGVVQGTLTHNIYAQPMWFGIAISSGDAFTGLPDSTTVFPATMYVDWVHIYKYNG